MAKGHPKSWEQYKAECEAVAKPGITVLGWVGEWKGGSTNLKCHCDKHGVWESTVIRAFKTGNGCPSCGLIAISQGKRDRRHSDEDWIELFMKTGKFKNGTVFHRNRENIDSQGRLDYWDYTCPTCSNDEYVRAGVCNGVFTGQQNELRRGVLSCRCATYWKLTKEQWEYRLSRLCEDKGYTFNKWKGKAWGSKAKFVYTCPIHGDQTTIASHLVRGCGCASCAGNNQQQCYINVVKDGTVPTAFKFGIARDSALRLRKQNRCNNFKMLPLALYEFPTTEDCKNAEKECKQTLKCRVVSKQDMPDGYTETVALTDYDKVVSIYERFGGVRLDTLTEEV